MAENCELSKHALARSQVEIGHFTLPLRWQSQSSNDRTGLADYIDRWSTGNSPSWPASPFHADVLATSGSVFTGTSARLGGIAGPSVAAARSVTTEQVLTVLVRHIAGRALGTFGEPLVNVLELNIDLQKH